MEKQVTVILSLMIIVFCVGIASSYLEAQQSTMRPVPVVSRSQEQFCSSGGASSTTASITTSQGTTYSFANYDEQLILAFNQSFSSLQYNVTATAQNDSFGYGPSYLLNGRTVDTWYQVGLAWNWGYANLPTHGEGFVFSAEVWNTSENSLLYSNFTGISSPAPISQQVSPGDSVLLSLAFSNGNVIMSLHDWNTSASAEDSYNAFGASEFAGGISDYTTGFMMEWFHVDPYFCLNNGRATFSSSTGSIPSSGWLGIDEWNFTNTSVAQGANASNDHEVLFANNRFVELPRNRSLVVSFSFMGTTVYANQYYFDTF